MKDYFDLDEWLLETESEEDKSDMHYDVFFLPKYERTEEECND